MMREEEEGKGLGEMLAVYVERWKFAAKVLVSVFADRGFWEVGGVGGC